MNKISISITTICIIVLAGFAVGLCLSSMIPKSLVCKVYTWDRPDGKIVHCLKVGSDVRGGQPEPEASATEYAYPTATETEWQPWQTMMPTWTPETYPEPATATPGEPYP
jgi:hypothetical protein